jgi:ArsR family transcriptional regulator
LSKTIMAPKRTTRPAAEVTTEVDEPIDLSISEDTIGDLTAVFKLLADKSRLKIVLALAQEGRMHVTALCRLLDQSQPAVSHHLTLMRMVGLIKFDRSGKHNFYYLDSGFLRDLIEQFFSDAGNGRQVLELEEFSLRYARAGD